MPNCCVPGCGNKSTDPRCVDITFHRLPLNNKEILKYWIDNLNLKEDQNIPDHRRVCSEHFDLQCFRQTSHTTKRCLLAGSIPHKFYPIAINLFKGNIENTEENMVHTCVVYGCKYRKKKNYNRDIIFHSFPLERERLQKWIEIIKKNSIKPIHVTKHSKICQMHFLHDDYVYQNDSNQTRYLKQTAMPSIFNITDNINLNKISNKTNKDQQQHVLQNITYQNSPLQQNTNVLNYTTSIATSSSTSPSYDDNHSMDEEYNDGDDDDTENKLHTIENNNNNQLEIASDTSDDDVDNHSSNENENCNIDDMEEQTLEIDINNEIDLNNQSIANENDAQQQSSQQNDLNTSSRSNSAKKRGLSDVINKLQSKQQQSTSSLSSLLNQTENNDHQQVTQEESPQSATISSVINAANTITPTKSTTFENNNKKQKPNKQHQAHQQQQQQQLHQPQALNTKNNDNKIIINQSNKSEMDLYRLLERANLLHYFNIFTEKGGDDINQLCEADEDEFKEICELVGMASKPLHIKRLRKALDEYKNTRSECSNDSFDHANAATINPGLNQNTTTNLTIPKCNINSPVATTNSSTHSTVDSVISTNSSNNGNAPLNYSINQQTSFQNRSSSLPYQHQSQTSQQQDESCYQNDVNHDDSQYDSAHDMGSTPYDYSKFNGNNKKKRRSRDSSESSCASEGSGDEYNGNIDAYGDSINNNSGIYNGNDTSINGENPYLYKNSNSGGIGSGTGNGSGDQNEKNAKKNKVVELYNGGERCVRKLSQLTGVPLTTVYRVIGKLKGINYNIPRGNGAGRKTILDTQDRETLVEILSLHPRISRKALGKELERRTGKSIHNSTLNRELCRLRHHGHNFSAVTNADSVNSSLNVTQSPSTTNIQNASSINSSNLKQSPTNVQNNNSNRPVNNSNNNNNRQQLAVETNTNSSIPHHQLSSSSSTTSSLSTTSSSYMAKDLIGSNNKSSNTRTSIKEQEQTKPLSLVNSSSRASNSSTPTPTMNVQQMTSSSPAPSTTPIQQNTSLLTSLAAALGYPAANPLAAATHLSRLPLFSQLTSSPFANLNQLAAYSSYLSGADLTQAFNAFNPGLNAPTPAITPTNTQMGLGQIDNDTIKQIIAEARKQYESIQKLDAKPLTNIKPEIASQITEIINGTFNADKNTRDETIRKLTANITRFDLQHISEKTYYECCLHEATVQLCILKPVLLTRREELLSYGKQIIKNLGIVETSNGKRLTTNYVTDNQTTTINNSNCNNSNKRIKMENNNYTPDFYQNAMSLFGNYFQQQQQQVFQTNNNVLPSTASSPSSTISSSSKFVSTREERLENLRHELQENLRVQESLRLKLMSVTSMPVDNDDKKNFIIQIQNQLVEENKKYNQLLDEQKRIEKQLKRKRPQKKGGNNVEDQEDEDEDENHQEQQLINENDAAVAALQQQQYVDGTGDYNNFTLKNDPLIKNEANYHHEDDNEADDNDDDDDDDDDEENINVDEYDDDNQHMCTNNDELASSTSIKTDTNNNRSFK